MLLYVPKDPSLTPQFAFSTPYCPRTHTPEGWDLLMHGYLIEDPEVNGWWWCGWVYVGPLEPKPILPWLRTFCFCYYYLISMFQIIFFIYTVAVHPRLLPIISSRPWYSKVTRTSSVPDFSPVFLARPDQEAYFDFVSSHSNPDSIRSHIRSHGHLVTRSSDQSSGHTVPTDTS